MRPAAFSVPIPNLGYRVVHPNLVILPIQLTRIFPPTLRPIAQIPIPAEIVLTFLSNRQFLNPITLYIYSSLLGAIVCGRNL